MKKHYANDLGFLGFNVLRSKKRFDGHTVCFCTERNTKNMWFVVHLNPEGHIEHSKSFIYSTNTRRKVLLSANKCFSNWCKILKERKETYS